jgi:hypothetical protein
MRSLLHVIDAIFYDTPTPSVRCNIISESKIAKGDSAWSTQKTLLGWHINTADMTLALPPHRQAHLLSLLQDLETKQRVSRKKWQQLLGELRSMALAISGAKYHFSLLQNALKTPMQPRIRITSLLRQALHDWTQLLKQLSHPVSLHTVVPQTPGIITGCNASALGIGGWLWDPSQPSTVYLWQHPFPDNIQRQVVSDLQPTGTITNSELELAPHPNIWCASDNMAAVAWANNGSTSSTSPSAFLLRALGQLSQKRHFSLFTFHVSGISNTIADSLSRHFNWAWDHLFTHISPLSTQTSWEIVQLPSDARLQVTSALLKQIWNADCQPEIRHPSPPHGEFQSVSARTCIKTPTLRSNTDPIPLLQLFA